MELNQAGQAVFRDRYACRDEAGQPAETPEQAVERIARAAAMAERSEEREFWAKEFARVIDARFFIPSTPIWANLGKDDRPWQPAACFVLAVEDSLESMYQTLKDTALICKSGGGVGFNFSRVRPRGDLVHSTKGRASGVVELIRLYNASADMIKQGGVRRGAFMGILNCDHPEIREFIRAKREGGFENFNLSVGISDSCMEAVIRDLPWQLSVGGEVRCTLPARELWREIAEAAWSCGDPGLVFLDRLAESNPLPDNPLEATNPCFHPDTMISTENGLERIEDIYQRAQGKEVFILTDNRASGCLKVVNGRSCPVPGVTLRRVEVVKTGRSSTIRVSLANGQEIKVTSDHRLLTESGWIRASELNVGDKVLVQSGPGFFASTDDIGTEMGWFLGWLVGDGWLTRDLTAGMVFGADDQHLIPVFQEIAARHGGGRRKAYLRPDGTWNVFWKEGAFIERLLQLGIRPARAGEKRVPRAIFTARRETVIAFLQALFSAAGKVNHFSEGRRDVRLSSGSRELLQDVQLLLLNLGVFCNICERRKKQQKGFCFVTQDGPEKTCAANACFELIINGDDLYNFSLDIGFKLNPKKAKKLSGIARRSRRSTCFMSAVTGIEPAEEVEVYDVIEPQTHSLIANGMIAHNCGEQPLSPGESCLLGSINLALMVNGEGDSAEVDWERLESTTRVAVRFLDNLIDLGQYPLELIAERTRASRKIGLGVLGLHDLLLKCRRAYDSEEGRELARQVVSGIRRAAHQTSRELAEEKGVFPDWERSIYAAAGDKRRNASCITIAPTGSITLLAGAEGYGIEPIFAVAYRKFTQVGTVSYFSPLFQEACAGAGVEPSVMEEVARRGSAQGVEGVPPLLQRIFRGAREIAPADHLAMQVVLQAEIDNAISKTINLPAEAAVEDIAAIYRQAYLGRLKGITVFREGSRPGVIETGEVSKAEAGKPGGPADRAAGGEKGTALETASPHRVRAGYQRGEIRPRPRQTVGITQRLDTGCGKLYLTVNYDPVSGEVIETFVTTGSDGGCRAFTESTSRLVSMAIRAGVSIPEIVEQLVSTRSCPSWQLARGRGRQLSRGTCCPSAIGHALQDIVDRSQDWSEGRFAGLPAGANPGPSGSTGLAGSSGPAGSRCPECGQEMAPAEGCHNCLHCGFSRC